MTALLQDVKDSSLLLLGRIENLRFDVATRRTTRVDPLAALERE